jgi:hypothetical protein
MTFSFGLLKLDTPHLAILKIFEVKMNKFKSALNVLAICLMLAAGSSLAQAQATRTWVSGVGDDANPCSRTAPCKTFAGAISKTATNGEIDAMDDGGYGAFTINKSLTVDGSGHIAAILANNTNGIVIAIDPNGADVLHAVRLRGLSIGGFASNANAGLRGIYITGNNFADVKVTVEDTVINSFSQEGIYHNANGGHLMVKNCSIRNNTGIGIRVNSAGANIAYSTIDKTMMFANAEGARSESNSRMVVHDSTLTSNVNGLVSFLSAGTSELNADSTIISNNTQWGILSYSAAGASSIIRISNVTVSNNASNGLTPQGGGQIISWKNNRISGNNPDGAPTSTLTEQ